MSKRLLKNSPSSSEEKFLMQAYHKELLELSDELSGKLLQFDCKKLSELSDQIHSAALAAQMYGHRLEDRLSSYQEALESLGFSRDKT